MDPSSRSTFSFTLFSPPIRLLKRSFILLADTVLKLRNRNHKPSESNIAVKLNLISQNFAFAPVFLLSNGTLKHAVGYCGFPRMK